jgi:tRNA threonylcarbamoyladenosine biosynthesis protein TsaB
MIICIETATNLCSVALCDSTGVLAVKESSDKRSHASMLTVFIQEILTETGILPSGLEAVAVSKGPGSYTGLRIGVSVAKGISFAASIPLIGIETTLSMYMGMKEKIGMKGNNDDNTLFCPMLDARRMEVYYALYDWEGRRINEITAKIIDPESFNSVPESRKIIFFGDGASKCADIIRRKNSLFIDDFSMSASYMQKPAYESFNRGNFEDVAYFEPFYLKDFLATIPRKNIF